MTTFVIWNIEGVEGGGGRARGDDRKDDDDREDTPIEVTENSLFLMNTVQLLNLLTPNVNYSGRTAPLTSKVAFYIFIQQI